MKNEAAAPSARLLQGTCSSDAKIKVVEEKVKVVPLVKRLTQPQSPNLTALTRTRSSKGKLSHTSRELLEIKKQKEEIQKERVKTKRYREATQVVISSRKKRKTPNEKENKLGLKMVFQFLFFSTSDSSYYCRRCDPVE